MNFYRIFNVGVQSELPLAGLPPWSDGTCSLAIHQDLPEQPEPDGFHWIHDWTSPSGTVIMRCARRGDAYLLSFPSLADFYIDLGKAVINIRASSGATVDTLAHLLMDQVIPRALGHYGSSIMHASAVVTPSGRALAFLGDSGCGKSTLASSYFREGAQVLTDDCLQLKLTNGQIKAMPSYASLRLWPESAEKMFGEREDLVPVAHYSNKQQLMLVGFQQSPIESARLEAVFQLNPVPQSEIRLERLPGSVAAVALIEAAFVLDVVDPSAVKQNFQQATRIAGSGVPVYRLSFPHRFEALPAVRHAIAQAVQQ